MAQKQWPALKAKLAAVFKTRTRDEWDAVMLGSDVCYAPILSFAEAVEHPHNRERQTYVDVGGLKQAAPAPRFSRTAPEVPAPAVAPGAQSREVLSAAGFSDAEIDGLFESGAVA